MARRSDHTRDQLHQMMLDAARHVAATDGPEAITARRIAGDIGYSPGTIYQLFDNLDALIVALKSVILAEILERLDAVNLSGKVRADVLALVDGYLTYERDEPALWRTLFDFSLPGGSEIPESFSHQIAGGLTRVDGGALSAEHLVAALAFADVVYRVNATSPRPPRLDVRPVAQSPTGRLDDLLPWTANQIRA